MPYTVSVAAVNSGGQGEWTTAGGVFFTMDLSEFSWKDHFFGFFSISVYMDRTKRRMINILHAPYSPTSAVHLGKEKPVS